MNKIVQTVILLAMILSTATGSAGTVSCKQGPTFWSLVNAKGTIIGASDVGYDGEEWCRTVAATEQQNLVCSWNGKSYQPYNTDLALGIGTEEKTSHYSNLSDCKDLIEVHKKLSVFFCGWNGQHFAPYNRLTNKLLSGDHQGWSNGPNECIDDTVSQALDSLICGWNNGPALYSADGLLLSQKFKRKEDCNGLLHSLLLQHKTGIQPAIIANQLKMTKDPKADPLRPFKNGTPDEKVGFPIGCQVKEHQYFHTKSVNGYIVPECAPDTLYSWGSFDKLEWYIKNMPNGGTWPAMLPQGLFTTPSAANTFGYGAIPMRFKIKPNVRFKLLVRPGFSTCDGYVQAGLVSGNDLQNTVVVRLDVTGTDKVFLEYLICSPQVIESWSFATQEHFDEIVRDHTWMTTKNYFQWESYVKESGKDLYLDNNIDSGSVYKTDFSLENLKQEMGFLRVLTKSGFGAINAPASPTAEVERTRHFQTIHPVYFNPN